MTDTSYADHEHRIMDRFTCTECGRPLELVEIRSTREERLRDPNHIEWIGACKPCGLGWIKHEWDRKREDIQP